MLKALAGATQSLPPQPHVVPISAGGTPDSHTKGQQGLNLIQGVSGESEAKILFIDHRWGRRI